MSPGLSVPPVGKPGGTEGDAVGVEVAIGWDRRHGLKHTVGQVRHDGRLRRERRNGLQRAEKSVRSPGPGGEVERIRDAAVPAVAETQGPEVVLAKRLTRVERERALPCSGRQVIGIDLRQALEFALLLPTSRSPPNWPQTRGRDMGAPIPA